MKSAVLSQRRGFSGRAFAETSLLARRLENRDHKPCVVSPPDHLRARSRLRDRPRAVIVAAARAEASAASQTTALQVTTTGAPQRVHGTDGREHIEFNLVITNSFTAEVTLTSLAVSGGGKELLTLSGDALAQFTYPIGTGPPTTSIPSSSTVETLIDSSCRAPPGAPRQNGSATGSPTPSRPGHPSQRSSGTRSSAHSPSASISAPRSRSPHRFEAPAGPPSTGAVTTPRPTIARRSSR